jgi:hypothetical protein
MFVEVQNAGMNKPDSVAEFMKLVSIHQGGDGFMCAAMDEVPSIATESG